MPQDNRVTDKDPALPDGTRIRTYDHGGVDAHIDGVWLSIASDPESCAALAAICLRTAEQAKR